METSFPILSSTEHNTMSCLPLQDLESLGANPNFQWHGPRHLHHSQWELYCTEKHALGTMKCMDLPKSKTSVGGNRTKSRLIKKDST